MWYGFLRSDSLTEAHFCVTFFLYLVSVNQLTLIIFLKKPSLKIQCISYYQCLDIYIFEFKTVLINYVASTYSNTQFQSIIEHTLQRYAWTPAGVKLGRQKLYCKQRASLAFGYNFTHTIDRKICDILIDQLQIHRVRSYLKNDKVKKI